jgi:flavin reductase (DIM6/NTAB) family NADH-FMN oxidoreductase RutF/DNA-binding FadR family transcriptional regulator
MADDSEAGSQRLHLDSREFRDIIGRFASGVAVITADYEGRPYGTTASAVSSLSLEPPMLLVCLNKTSSTGRAVGASRRFAVNILAEGQIDTAMHFGSKGDKFAGQPIVRGIGGEPILEDALAILECRVVEEVAGGTHTVFLAEVEHATGRQGPPLAYFRGQFGRLELKQDDDAYREIRARIMNRELPVGNPLVLDDVSEMVKVPRGSAYFALTKLSGEGLVTRSADGAFVVTPVTVESVAEALTARRTIETGVVVSTIGKMSEAQLAEFRAAVEATRPPLESEFDVGRYTQDLADFRRSFVGLAGSPALVDLHRRVNTIAMNMSVTGPKRVPVSEYVRAAERAYHHHLRLLEAYERSDLKLAITVIQEHIDDTFTYAQRHIEAVGGEL